MKTILEIIFRENKIRYSLYFALETCTGSYTDRLCLLQIKVRTEFERKHKQIEIQSRIAFSNEVGTVGCFLEIATSNRSKEIPRNFGEAVYLRDMHEHGE